MNDNRDGEDVRTYGREAGPANGTRAIGISGYETSSYGDSGKHSLVELADVLLRGKWIILACFVLITGATAIYNYRLSPVYEASTLLLVAPQQAPETDIRGIRSGLLGRSNSGLANELVVLRNSLAITRGTAERLLEKRETSQGDMLTILENVEADKPDVEALARRLQWQYISIAPEPGNVDFLRVTARSTVPDEAALLANLYSNEYVDRTRESSRSRLTASRAYLEEQEKVRLAELTAIEKDVTEFISREGAVELDLRGQQIVSQIAQLEAMRDEANIDLFVREAHLRTLEQELADIHPQLAQRVASDVERDIVTAQSKLAELDVERQQIYLRNPSLQTSGDETPELLDKNRQIAQLEDRVAELSRQYVDEVLAVGGINLEVGGSGLARIAELKRQVVTERIGISGAEAKIGLVEARIEQYEANLETLPEQSIMLAQLQRRRQAAERMYINVTERLQEVRIAEEVELGYAEIVREALVPSAPVYPQKERNILYGALLALGFGLVLATVQKRLDNRVYTPDDLRSRGEIVIGTIPDMKRYLKEEFGRKETVVHESGVHRTSLVSLLRPTSPAAEAFRHVRTNIQFSRPDTVVQTLLVTSPNQGEGKTVTATNLAVAMANAGRRTLLIDADMRRPRAHEHLGMDREPGLIELLFEETPLDASRLKTSVVGLHFIPTGRRVPNPSELLGTMRMRELIRTLREHYDFIVFDTPPVLAATDASLLSTQCDATIVVTHAATTRHHDLDHCMSALGSVGATIIGTMLNGFDPSLAYGYSYRYGYYGKYYTHGYGYGYQDVT